VREAYLSKQVLQDRMDFLGVRDLRIEVVHSLTDLQRSDEAGEILCKVQTNPSCQHIWQKWIFFSLKDAELGRGKD
jgi:hypothetical protein